MSGEVHPRLPCGHVICFGSVLTGNSSRNVNLRGAGFHLCHSLAVCPWTKLFPFLDYIYSIYKVRRETSSEVLDLKVSKSVSGGREVGCVCVFVYMYVCVCVRAHMHFSESRYQIHQVVCDAGKIQNPWVRWSSCSRWNNRYCPHSQQKLKHREERQHAPIIPLLPDIPVPTSNANAWHLRRHESWNAACLWLSLGIPSCFDNTKMYERKETPSPGGMGGEVSEHCLGCRNIAQLLPAHQRLLSAAIRLLFKLSSRKEDIS